ncbi:uncharacterized protein LOC120357641 [Solenopsis invicta]|uniref:uncharacterized protein LOC120357641 n=1 Tax=Solenopsis invicta TaxID=13686 RepID=UPI00193DB6A4|nr:uncharacterized protein LOC120357641 [Solenopsis invicta]
MFLILFDVLQELLFTEVNEKPSLSHKVSAIGDTSIDANNNDFHTIITRNIKQHDFATGTTKDFETDYCSLRSAAVCPKNCDVACRKKSATISTKDAGSSMKNAFDTASYPMIHEEYKKSSYRDISKDFCVSNITVAYEALNCSIS